MVDFIKSIGTTITNILDFIVGVVNTFKGIGQAVLDFFTLADAFISILPLGVQAIIIAALVLLAAFIVIELLRDFL